MCCIASTEQVTINGEWSSWQNRVPKIEVETHKVGSPDVVVPTLDTVRHESLLNTWLAEHKPMVLCGPPGSGKTMTLLSALRSLPDFEVCSGWRWPMCVPACVRVWCSVVQWVILPSVHVFWATVRFALLYWSVLWYCMDELMPVIHYVCMYVRMYVLYVCTYIYL